LKAWLGQGRSPHDFSVEPVNGALKNREGAMVVSNHQGGRGLPFRAWSLVWFAAFPWGMEKRPGLTRNVARNSFSRARENPA
jgi:hypothetical protein